MVRHQHVTSLPFNHFNVKTNVNTTWLFISRTISNEPFGTILQPFTQNLRQRYMTSTYGGRLSSLMVICIASTL